MTFEANVTFLNDEFLLFRTNAVQRTRFNDEDDDEHASLLRDAGDLEIGNGGQSTPGYVAQAEAVAFRIDRLRIKVDELCEALKTEAEKPLFEDDVNVSKALSKQVGAEIADVYARIKKLRSRTESSLRGLEANLAANVVRSLSDRLQEVTESLRLSQGDHLKRVEKREAENRLYFDDFSNDETAMATSAATPNAMPMERVMTTQELLLLEEDTRHLESREREINEIVRSISDLNLVFKELAQMVSEQGSVIDRIDYNVEHTQIKVKDGLEQLKKAERYQRKNRKMKCIFILAVIVVVLLIALAIKVS